MGNVVEKIKEIIEIYNGYSPVDISEHIEGILDPERKERFIAINSFKGGVLFSIWGRFNSPERIREKHEDLVRKMIERAGFSLEECVGGLMENINLIVGSIDNEYGQIDNMPQNIQQFMVGTAHTLLSLRNEA